MRRFLPTIRLLPMLTVAFTASLGFLPIAHASRIVFFDVNGTSETFNQDENSTTISAACYITLTNSSTVSQTYIAQLSGTVPNVTATTTNAGIAGQVANYIGGGKNGAAFVDAFSNSTNVSAVLAPQARAVFVWQFPVLPPNTVSRQDSRCKGSITVDDTDPTQPGFVTANGIYLTWLQSQRAQNGFNTMKSVTNQIKTPFEIGESRPF